MGRLPSVFRKIFVEECEIVTASDHASYYARRDISLHVEDNSPRGQRSWLKCPTCGRRSFKLYRPPNSAVFACRECHDLTYRSVQEHDARLDRLLKMPDALLAFYVLKGTITWKLLAIGAGYIRLGSFRRERSRHARLRRSQKIEPGMTKSIGKFVVAEDFLDTHFVDVIIQDEHPRRGAQDQIRAIEIGYQKLGFID